MSSGGEGKGVNRLDLEGRSLFAFAVDVGPAYRVRVLNFGGDLLCTLEDCGDMCVAELKQRVAAHTGLHADTTVLWRANGELPLADNEKVASTCIAVEQTIELHAQKLRKIVVAERLGVKDRQITDRQLNELCNMLEAERPDILDVSFCGLGACQFGNALSINGVMTSLNISNNALCAAGGKTLAEALKDNQTMTELDISSNSLGKESAQDSLSLYFEQVKQLVSVAGWAPAPHTTLANDELLEVVAADPLLADADIANGAELLGKVAMVHRGGCMFVEKAQRVQAAGAIAMLCVNNDEGEPDRVSAVGVRMGYNEQAENININIPVMMVSFNSGAILAASAKMAITIRTSASLADAIKNHQVLTKLTISGDSMNSKPITIQTSMTEADFSGKILGASGAIMLAAFLSKCQALTSLNISNNNIGEPMLPEGWSDKGSSFTYRYVDAAGETRSSPPAGSKPAGLIALADGLKNNRAMVSVNILSNNIGTEQAHNLAAILKEHATLKSLCGNKGDATALDMRGKMDDDGAIMLAPEVAANRNLSSLDISQVWYEDWDNTKKNPKGGISAEGANALAEAIRALEKLTFSGDNDSNKIVTMKTSKRGKANFKKSRLGTSGAIMLAAFLPKCQAITSLDISNNALCGITSGGFGRYDALGVLALADAIGRHQGLATLNVRRNSIPNDLQSNLKRICKSKGIKLLLD